MTVDIDTSSSTAPIIIMTRVFEAPRELVWAMFTEPKHVAKWYGGRGFENPVCEMDVRPGGLWRHVMRTPSGEEFANEFVFVEVIKPEKLSWQHIDYGREPSGAHPTSRMTVTLEEAGANTRWRLVTEFSSFEERALAQRIGFAEAIAEGSDKLNALAKALYAQTQASSVGRAP